MFYLLGTNGSLLWRQSIVVFRKYIIQTTVALSRFRLKEIGNGWESVSLMLSVGVADGAGS